jgi:hypothetical protein
VLFSEGIKRFFSPFRQEQLPPLAVISKIAADKNRRLIDFTQNPDTLAHNTVAIAHVPLARSDATLQGDRFGREKGQRQPDHSDQVTTTNISQLKATFVQQIRERHGKPVAEAAHNNRACRGEREKALVLYESLSELERQKVPQVLCGSGCVTGAKNTSARAGHRRATGGSRGCETNTAQRLVAPAVGGGPVLQHGSGPP